MQVQFYAYEAALHCPRHADERFGEELYHGEAVDSEGNEVSALYSWDLTGDECCDECVYETVLERITAEDVAMAQADAAALADAPSAEEYCPDCGSDVYYCDCE